MKNKVDTLIINDKRIKASYLFSHRKSLVIRIISDCEIEIRAPHLIAKHSVDRFVNQKSDWIFKKCSHFKYREEGILFYLGDQYQVVRNEAKSISVEGGCISIPSDFDDEKISQWYKRQSEDIINDLYKNLIFEKVPAKISIRKQNKRWGSCNSKGNINISSKIAMCPVEVIEYVLYHELCHLVHMNHSKDFYLLLGRYCKDYRQKEKWLKEHHHQLTW
ncbi:MAG: M48 family metallopeptidase [Clostridia bacterium]|nr:M48 family metallopeptidase [Clostridia bacterium]